MKFGISMFVTDRSARPDEVAAAVEERGFDSFWVSEHSHIPQSSPPPFPGFDPRVYSAMLDPFVALTAAAMATRRILLGTAVCLVTQRDPIDCAKAVASLDQLSGGRVLFGIGAGWNREELVDHGTDPDTRFRLMRERVQAMQALWTEESPSYHGRHVRFDPVWQWPKPAQQPHPPVLVAGAGPGVLKRVVDYGNGWLPVVVPEASGAMAGRVTPIAQLAEWLPKLTELAAAAGKPPPVVTAMGPGLEGGYVQRLGELGVERMVLRAEPAPLDDVLRTLDGHREAVLALGERLAD